LPNAQLEISKAAAPATLRLSRTAAHTQLVPLGTIEFFEGGYDNAVSSSIQGTRASGTSGRGELVFFTLPSSGSLLQERMRILYNGKVGIGVSTPTHNLQVAGNSKWSGTASSFTEIDSNEGGQYLRQYGNDGTTVSWLIRGYAVSNVQAEFNSGGVKVNGTVKAKEVNVTASGWPDYVFGESYHLKPLEEVQKFYKTNGHLENIPTADEVTENGVNLSEMTVKLLEKVEELTVYLVEQNSKIRALEKEIAALKKR